MRALPNIGSSNSHIPGVFPLDVKDLPCFQDQAVEWGQTSQIHCLRLEQEQLHHLLYATWLPFNPYLLYTTLLPFYPYLPAHLDTVHLSLLHLQQHPCLFLCRY
ncbi:unnamed protein product [Merluccius merluccius]